MTGPIPSVPVANHLFRSGLFRFGSFRFGSSRFGPGQSAHVVGLMLLALVAVWLWPAAVWSKPASSGTEDKASAKAVDVPFAPGEKLTFDLLVMGAKAGTGTLQVGKHKKHKGKKVLPLLATMRSATFFDKVYRVRDTMASLTVVADRFFPIHTEFQSDRKGVKREYVYSFEGRQGKVKGTRVRDEKGKRTESAIDEKAPPFTHDVLSWIYHLRTVPMVIGEVIVFNTHSGNWLYDARCKVEAVESVWTPLGSLEAHRVKMVVTRAGDKKFKQEAVAWFGTDADRLPVRIQFDFSLGSGEAILTDVQRSNGSTAAAAPKIEPKKQ